MNDFLIIASFILLLYTFYPKIMIKFNKNVKNISAEEAKKLISSNKDIIILDVRTKGEYLRGHLKGSKLMPSNELSSRINELEKYRGKSLLVHCASGGRSPIAVKILLKNNFTNIYHMNKGLAGWTGSFVK